jgi:alpha-glucuronidase
MRDWARLLASVRINALAPQDLNWFEPNNFLKHLKEVGALAALLRSYGIRLFWSPNFLLAPQQAVADALFAVAPDFGGYLLKVGSESQGGTATPTIINEIARTLVRKPGSGQLNGTVFVRAFIYGSEYCTDNDESKTNRMAIPAQFFRPFDGQYDKNVYILGKYSALDCEFINARLPLRVLPHQGFDRKSFISHFYKLLLVLDH